jgi:putative hydrolase
MWKVIADYHTHTKYSRGGGSIADNARAAHAAGLEIVGIADHGPANWGHLGMTKLATFERIIRETKEVERSLSGIKVLAGIEANIISYDGQLDIPLELQRRLDVVLAGFHLAIAPQQPYEGLKYFVQTAFGKVSPRWRQKARDENTRAIVAAVYQNEIDIITHPGLGISIDTSELARACAKTGTALEINSKHGALTVDFIKAAAREGVKFAIGSDAHQPTEVGRLAPGVRAAQAAGLGVEQIINVREV